MEMWVWKCLGAGKARVLSGREGVERIGRKVSELNGRFRGIVSLTTLVLVVLLPGCSKEAAPVPSDPEEEFRFHLYVVPDQSEKAPNNLQFTINVDGQNFVYTTQENEVTHTMMVKVPSAVTVRFTANSQMPATFHFRAYQGEQAVWGGGNGCRSNSYTKRDKIHFYR